MTDISELKVQVSEIIECGRLRQILERGYLSSDQIQFVIDATVNKLNKKKE